MTGSETLQGHVHVIPISQHFIREGSLVAITLRHTGVPATVQHACHCTHTHVLLPFLNYRGG